jgi:hypothetical protein
MRILKKRNQDAEKETGNYVSLFSTILGSVTRIKYLDKKGIEKTLATTDDIPSVSTPTLKLVTDAGSTTDNEIMIGDTGLPKTFLAGEGIGGQNGLNIPTWAIDNNDGKASFTQIYNLNGIVKPYKEYVANLEQQGDTSDPIATIMWSDLENPIVWTRTGEATYTGTLTGVFTADKTYLEINLHPKQVGDEVVADFYRGDANNIRLDIYAADGSTPSEGFIAQIKVQIYN